MTANGRIPPTLVPHTPVAGVLSGTLLTALKAAPGGSSDEEIVINAIRSLPVDQLRAALTALTPIERNMLFSAIPPGEISSLLRQAVSVLAPVTPPPPAPAPTGGPPASILTTTYQNVPYPPAESDPNWSQTFSGGSTIGLTTPPPWEWVSVYDPSFEKEGSLNNPMVGLTGWAVASVDPGGISGADVWFVHPFGHVDANGKWSGDWEFYIVPDPQYEGLLASTNGGPNSPVTVDKEFSTATSIAQAPNFGLPASKGVLGLEIDQGMVPQAFRNTVTDKARVAAFGRWIVDCGHNDFHTEIHSPLVIATATVNSPPQGRPGASQMTSLQLWSRPYTVSQQWDDGNFIRHLLAEVAEVETTILGVPLNWRVKAHPTVLTKPYDGRPYIELLVAPPPPKSAFPVVHEEPRRLMVSFHFTHRAGVALEVYDAGNGTVGIVIVLGDLNPATLPAKHDLTVSWSQLGSWYPDVIDGLEIADILTLDIGPALILNRGILTDIYDPPQMSSPLDGQNVVNVASIDGLPAGGGVSEDDKQPFPVYGWLNVWWEPLVTSASTG
jgi:hypothetical protein